MLRQYVRDFFTGLKVPIEVIDDIMSDITARYGEQGRFYHTLTHIEDFLQILVSHENITRDPVSLILASIFHDIVYDTKKSDNEEKSAAFAAETLTQMNMQGDVIRKITNLIISTKKHLPFDDSIDSKLFLDGDLAILGAETKKYLIYSKSIREEYSWVSEKDYKKGRKNVLEQFLLRESIYYTEEFKNNSGDKARINIQNEIQGLNQP